MPSQSQGVEVFDPRWLVKFGGDPIVLRQKRRCFQIDRPVRDRGESIPVEASVGCTVARSIKAIDRRVRGFAVVSLADYPPHAIERRDDGCVQLSSRQTER
jgi:hypothetical protein